VSRVVLLGPQRLRPTVAATLRSLGVAGPVATVTAGWQEREPDDAELDAHLGGPALNLGLYVRWRDVLERDPELAAADLRRRSLLEEMRELYELRLDLALQAVGAVARRPGGDGVRSAELEAALDAVRDLDARHFERAAEVHAAFYSRWPPHERPAVRRHREAVARALGASAALAIAGGHVGALGECLHLFNVAAAVGDRPVVAWSAGAMAICDRIVLFHDDAAQGSGHPEVFDAGIGLCQGIVPLPHARRRLHLQDRQRMSLMARRFAPAVCVPLDEGDRLDGDVPVAPRQRVIHSDGRVCQLQAA